MATMVDKKICKACRGKPQPLKNFSIHRTAKDGRNSTCRLCMKKDYAYYKKRYAIEKDSRKLRKPTDGIPWPATTTM